MSLRPLVDDIISTLGWRIYLSVFLATLVAITEGLTISAILPLLSVIGLSGSDGGGVIAELSQGLFLMIGLEYTLGSVAWLLAVLIALSLVLFLINAQLATSLQARYVASWQIRLSHSMVHADWAQLQGIERGVFISSISVEATRLGSAFYQINLIVTSIVFIITQGFIAVVFAPAATLVLVSFAAALFVLTRALARRASEDGRSLTLANTKLAGSVGEISSALKFVKATAREGKAISMIKTGIDNIEKASVRSAFDIQLTRAVFDYGGMSAIILMLVFGHGVAGYDVGSMIVVVAIFVRLFPKVTALRQCLQSIAVLLPAFSVCRSIVDEACAVVEHIDARSNDAMHQPSVESIELSDVAVSTAGGKVLLEDISLKINPGEYIAIVGPSGAGKSTLLDVIIGLIVPSRGTVLINDSPLAPGSVGGWRRRIGYLGQEPVIFSGSIFENVTWGRTDLDASQVTHALKLAAAEEIRGSEIDTVGEGGGMLSGGEKQRVALARALVGSPSLIVLDEATSALDVQAEERILKTLRSLKGLVSIVVVSHKLVSVKDADKIFVLSGGRLVQSGSFVELLSSPGWFQDSKIYQGEVPDNFLIKE